VAQEGNRRGSEDRAKACPERVEGAPHSTILTEAEEAMVVAFRRHTLLPLDDCLYALQPSIPHLTRSALHRCLQRHGISRLSDIEGDKALLSEVEGPKRQRFKRYPIGFFHIDIAEVQIAEGKARLSLSKGSTCSLASTAPASSRSPNWSTKLIDGQRGSSWNTC
jgi:hypothetical protein